MAMVTKLDRLVRSLPDARDIEDLTKRNIKLNLAGSIHARTREGMQIAKAKGKLRGKQPMLSKAQEKHLVALHHGGQHTSAEIAELFGVARSTVNRIVHRAI